MHNPLNLKKILQWFQKHFRKIHDYISLVYENYKLYKVFSYIYSQMQNQNVEFLYFSVIIFEETFLILM